MKIIAAILFFLIVTSSLFYYGYFDAVLLHSKEKARQNITAAEDRQTLKRFKISVKEKDKYNDDEAWINGELYDIAERKTEGDSISLYLYHDADEESILSEIGDFFKPDDNTFIASSPDIPVFKSVRIIPNPQYILYALDFSLRRDPASHEISLTRQSYQCSQVFDVPIPPPKISSVLF